MANNLKQLNLMKEIQRLFSEGLRLQIERLPWNIRLNLGYKPSCRFTYILGLEDDVIRGINVSGKPESCRAAELTDFEMALILDGVEEQANTKGE